MKHTLTKLAEAVAFVGKPNKILHLDLETNNNPYYGAVASPRHPDNYVVAVGWAIDEKPYSGNVQYEYYNCAEEAKDWLHIPDDVWLLVAHNAAYELDWMLYQQRDKILAFLKRGGKIFCTAYGHYLLSNQQDTYPPLDQVAPLYGGTHKVDGIKALWERGVLTKDIDRDLLVEYLVGPEGDIENTRKCFYGEYSKLVVRGMWKGAMQRMEGLLFCATAMDSGLYVNRELAFAQLKLQDVRLQELLRQFAMHRAEFPADAEFKESSRFHMSAWIYGGPLRYRSRLPWLNEDGSYKYEKADFYKFKDGHRVLVEEYDNDYGVSERCDLEMDHGDLIVATAGKLKGMPRVHREDTETIKLKWYDLIHQCKGLVDLHDLPDNIREEFLKEYTGKQTLADGSPVIATASDPIEMLSKRKEFPPEVQQVMQALMEFAKLDKDLGTYYLREQCDEEGNVIKQAGMLQYLNEKSYVHHNLNCTSTVTGRLSSNKPNFQNLPRGGTSNVKKMFTSRFGNDGFIVEADYSALEVVTLAAFSKDKALTRALLDGIDMHCMRLSQLLKEPYDEVLKKCKDQSHPDHAEYDKMRTDIKPKAFAYQYGATAYGIAFNTGCTVEEAQAFIDAEKSLFPEVEAYYDKVIFPAVEESTKRHREEVEGVWRIYGVGTWQAPGGTTYEFRQWPKSQWIDGRRQTLMQYAPTQMRNYPIQGESGFFVQGVCGLVVRWLINRDFYADADGNARVFIINTVHDAIYVDCHKDVLDEVCGELKRIMETLPQHFEKNLGYDLGVPFPAAVEFGVSMFHKVHWHPGVLDDPAYEKDGKTIPSIKDQLEAQRADLAQTIKEASEIV